MTSHGRPITASTRLEIADDPFQRGLALFRMAGMHHDYSTWNAAIDLFSLAIEANKQAEDAYVYRGRSLFLSSFGLSHWDEVMSDYDTCLTINPSHKWALELKDDLIRRYRGEELGEAVKDQDIDRVKSLVAKVPSIEWFRYRSKKSHVAQMAARSGTAELMKYLLDLGVDMEIRAHENRTPLLTALMHNNIDVAVVLLQRGAEQNVYDLDGMHIFHIMCHKQLSLESFSKLFANTYSYHLLDWLTLKYDSAEHSSRDLRRNLDAALDAINSQDASGRGARKHRLILAKLQKRMQSYYKSN